MFLPNLDIFVSFGKNFPENASLRREFDELYYALFKNADKYIDVVRALYEKSDGLTRKEISTKWQDSDSKIMVQVSNFTPIMAFFWT